MKTDLAKLFLDRIYERMQIDAEWSVRDDAEFTWWPGALRQRIWVDPSFDDEGMTIWRAHCRTDLIRGFGGTRDERESVTSYAMYETLSGFARDPADSSKVQKASSIFFHEETFDWACEMMAWIAPIQACEAHRDADAVAERSDQWEPDHTPHPKSGARAEADEMLNLAQFVFQKGYERSEFEGPEMVRMTRAMGGPPSLMTNGGATGITAEYPFPGGSMLLQASTKEFNQNLGRGLLTLLKLPGNPEGKLPADCLSFNELELSSMTRSHFVGSWCHGPNGVLTFVTFIPSVLYSPATTERVIMNDMMRALWISETLLGFSWEANYDPYLAKKLALISGLEGPTKN